MISDSQGVLAAQLLPRYVVRVEERASIIDESDLSSKRIRIPDVEVIARPGWHERQFSPGGETSQVGVALPIVATTWLEEHVHEAF